jgi:hypothetical protein
MKKCKECCREEWGFLSALNDDGYCPTCAMRKAKSRYSELVQKMHILEQQLQEANVVIQHYAEKNGYHKAMDYLNKWGVK